MVFQTLLLKKTMLTTWINKYCKIHDQNISQLQGLELNCNPKIGPLNSCEFASKLLSILYFGATQPNFLKYIIMSQNRLL